MPYRKQHFANDEIYHITLRAIDDNLIFKDISDYYRGIFSIYEFNNTNPVIIRERRRSIAHSKKIYRGPTSVNFDKREKMVDLLVFCFMPNHIHLLARQSKDSGITEFIRKIGTGYSGYFNKKYKRKGHFFQNRFYSVHIKNDEQLRTVFAYIHTNPLSIIDSDWKKIRIENSDKYLNFLKKEYRWSSCFDYLGNKNFPSVTEREFITDLLGGKQGCENFIKYWIEYKGESKEYSNLFLE